ncbi:MULTISPECIES: hypothetical protein [Sphingobacterium]|uniref:Outer membrane protein with beta-barrel domain n=2 Tax=Sphingobacterium TaxID=28453 RepID=A0A4R6WKZ6_9SPHI|nr:MULTISPECIES: hypothetical protein [Sphingobacterium]TDQ79392.1 hypothetical protein CLV99_0829 [Sphingobacterium yanglingense]
MNRTFLVLVMVFLYSMVFAQSGADTIHYKKVYYFAGTGLGIPLGKTRDVLSPKLFVGSMGLDITLNNPKYYLYPALYLLAFKYDQKAQDPEFNTIIKNGLSNFYMLSLAAGTRRQFERLNTYVYLGPTIGLVHEPRSNLVGDVVNIEYLKSIAFGTKLGVGADYRFSGFFIGTEVGYMYNVNRVQKQPFHALTLMVGLKSDITRLSDKVVDILAPH